MNKGIIAIVMLVIVCACDSSSPEEKAARELDVRREETHRIARKMIVASSKDPDSVKFQNQKGPCGEVNEKGGRGGEYVGFRRFLILTPRSVQFEPKADDADREAKREFFQTLWESLCDRKGLKEEYEETEYLWDKDRGGFFIWDRKKKGFYHDVQE
jgi:hypothetical protein